MMDGMTGPLEQKREELTRRLNAQDTEPAEYPVGTRVRFLDVEGTIIENNSYDWHRFMTVRLDSGRELLFERDGRYISESDVKLEVIGRVKPKVKKWRWAYKYPGVKSAIAITPLKTPKEAEEFFSEHKINDLMRLEWTMEEQDA
jgi:hypothetical protein